MKLKKIILIIPIVASLAAIVALANLQRKELDYEIKYESLTQKSLLRPLNKWSAQFQVCENHNPAKCKRLEFNRPIDFSNQGSINQFLANRPASANSVRMIYQLSFADLAWMKSRPITNIVIAATQAIWLGFKTGNLEQGSYGLLRDYIFTMPQINTDIGSNNQNKFTDELSAEEIEISWIFGDNWLSSGPILHPPNLADLSAIQDFTGLYQTYRIESETNRQIDTIIPVLFSAVAFVLNHAPEATILSLYGSLKALRTVLYQTANNKSQLSLQTEYLALGLNLLALCLVTFFLMDLTQFRAKKWQKRMFVTFAALLLWFSHKFIDRSFYKIDLITDGVSGLLMLACGIKLIIEKKPHHEKSRLLQLGQSLLLLIGGFLTAQVNYNDFYSYLESGSKNFTDPRHLILFPILVTILFIDMGTVVNTIKKVSSIVRAKALIDKDLELSSVLQKATMPEKKGVLPDFKWRIIYRPAAVIGGDWHDIREIYSADGNRYLAAIVADVTGHGISAALLTTAIASQWGIWCSDFKNMTPQSPEDFEQILGKAIENIHKGLIALRQNQGASVACLLIGTGGKCCYINAGHPGILMADSHLNYLSRPGQRPGSQNISAEWKGVYFTTQDRPVTFVAYTDGLQPSGTSHSQWIKSLKIKYEIDNQSIKSLIGENILRRRFEFKTSKILEDDLTVLFIDFNQTKLAERQQRLKT